MNAVHWYCKLYAQVDSIDFLQVYNVVLVQAEATFKSVTLLWKLGL